MPLLIKARTCTGEQGPRRSCSSLADRGLEKVGEGLQLPQEGCLCTGPPSSNFGLSLPTTPFLVTLKCFPLPLPDPKFLGTPSF